VTLHAQGDVNFIINAEKDSFAQAFALAHGPSACAMAFRVKDAAFAYRGRWSRREAWPQSGSDGTQHPSIEGIGAR